MEMMPATAGAAGRELVGSAGWHLGFDPATKTLGYCLCRIDLVGMERDTDRLSALQEACMRPESAPHADRLLVAARQLSADVRERVRIQAGSAVDLFPGRPDKNITAKERITACVSFLQDTIVPVCKMAGCVPTVYIEMQPELINCRSRVIEECIFTFFTVLGWPIVCVGSSVKNTLDFGERYGDLMLRYKSRYYANKKHSRSNFDWFALRFDCRIAPLSDEASHVADCFMQIVGTLARAQAAGPSAGPSAGR